MYRSHKTYLTLFILLLTIALTAIACRTIVYVQTPTHAESDEELAHYEPSDHDDDYEYSDGEYSDEEYSNEEHSNEEYSDDASPVQQPKTRVDSTPKTNDSDENETDDGYDPDYEYPDDWNDASELQKTNPHLTEDEALIIATRPREHKDCRQTGCAGEAKCVPRDQLNCAASRYCKDYGSCTLFSESKQNTFGEYMCTDWMYEACGAETDAHCQASSECKEHGTCTAGSYLYYHSFCAKDVPKDQCYDVAINACMPSKSGCAQSNECTQLGRCGLNQFDSTCRPQSKNHCQNSTICKTQGKCDILFESGNLCAPTTQAHCQKSDACKNDKKCTLHQNQCVTSAAAASKP